jgi:hypothetical protein
MGNTTTIDDPAITQDTNPDWDTKGLAVQDFPRSAVQNNVPLPTFHGKDSTEYAKIHSYDDYPDPLLDSLKRAAEKSRKGKLK